MGKASRARREKRELNAIKANSLRYDMRNPCSDCPYRTDAPWHPGIFDELVIKAGKMRKGELAHTCHQTDYRADCAPDKRAPSKAPIQHCAGMLIMAEKMGLQQVGAIVAQINNVFDPTRLNMNAPVFSSILEMFAHYLELSLTNVSMSAANRARIIKTISNLRLGHEIEMDERRESR